MPGGRAAGRAGPRGPPAAGRPTPLQVGRVHRPGAESAEQGAPEAQAQRQRAARDHRNREARGRHGPVTRNIQQGLKPRQVGLQPGTGEAPQPPPPRAPAAPPAPAPAGPAEPAPAGPAPAPAGPAPAPRPAARAAPKAAAGSDPAAAAKAAGRWGDLLLRRLEWEAQGLKLEAACLTAHSAGLEDDGALPARAARVITCILLRRPAWIPDFRRLAERCCDHLAEDRAAGPQSRRPLRQLPPGLGPSAAARGLRGGAGGASGRCVSAPAAPAPAARTLPPAAAPAALAGPPEPEPVAAPAGGATRQPRKTQLARALASYPAASFSQPGHGAPASAAAAGAASAEALSFAEASSPSASGASGASGSEAGGYRSSSDVPAPAKRVQVSGGQASRSLQARASGSSRGRQQAQAQAPPSPHQLAQELQERLSNQRGLVRAREADAHPRAQDARQRPHRLASPLAAEQRSQQERDARQQWGTSAQQAVNVRRGRSEASAVQTLESLPEVARELEDESDDEYDDPHRVARTRDGPPEFRPHTQLFFEDEHHPWDEPSVTHAPAARRSDSHGSCGSYSSAARNSAAGLRTYDDLPDLDPLWCQRGAEAARLRSTMMSSAEPQHVLDSLPEFSPDAQLFESFEGQPRDEPMMVGSSRRTESSCSMVSMRNSVAGLQTYDELPEMEPLGGRLPHHSLRPQTAPQHVMDYPWQQRQDQQPDPLAAQVGHQRELPARHFQAVGAAEDLSGGIAPLGAFAQTAPPMDFFEDPRPIHSWEKLQTFDNLHSMGPPMDNPPHQSMAPMHDGGHPAAPRRQEPPCWMVTGPPQQPQQPQDSWRPRLEQPGRGAPAWEPHRPGDAALSRPQHAPRQPQAADLRAQPPAAGLVEGAPGQGAHYGYPYRWAECGPRARDADQHQMVGDHFEVGGPPIHGPCADPSHEARGQVGYGGQQPRRQRPQGPLHTEAAGGPPARGPTRREAPGHAQVGLPPYAAHHQYYHTSYRSM